MARKFLVFQHSPWEGPGKILREVARANNIELDVIRLWEEKIPDPGPYACLLVLGGGPNVDQEEEFPFLVEEKKVIKKSLDDNRPYLGFCLGHQLLAAALGAQVGKNHRSSIGFTTGYLTHNGYRHPAFAGLPDCFPIFKWHGQTVKEPLPRHLKILATSVDCQIEALSVVERPHILGIQFDNHSASGEEVAAWLDHDREWLASLTDLDINRARILAEAERTGPRIRCEFEIFFTNFLNLIDRNRPRKPARVGLPPIR
ncbi:MAG: type 1 glutamine amidotransferase [Desulfobulbaceae bacterium]|nr:type 1 glutamine amidotransferase [Desulfobulbaceae bacterium]